MVAMLLAATPGFVVAAGDAGERRTGSPRAADAASSILGSDLDRAVQLVSDVSRRWTYDAVERIVHAPGAPLPFPLVLADEAWRETLDPSEYHVLREKGTERPFSSPLYGNKQRGIYYSRATGQPLFSSQDKYESGSGWPSFTRPINPYAIVYIGDDSLFVSRIEVVDSLSGSHLGHVFPDGPAPTGQRYCINGAALVFVPDGGEPPPIRLSVQGQ